MKVFVYYYDAYDVAGIEQFASRDEAARFIERQMSGNPDLKKYTVIEGRILHAEAVSVATRIDIRP